MRNLIGLMRPHQYIKNGFIFLGPLFSRQWGLEILLQAGLAFIAFSLIASAVYIMNDLLDLESDRQHPLKSRRPLARGVISIRTALLLLVGLLIIALLLALWIAPLVAALLLTYFIINIFYSLWWKHQVILDVFIIATGFMLRILVGTVGLAIMPSPWILLCGMMVTLFLGFSKRYAEIIGNREGAKMGSTRPVLAEYSEPLLQQLIAILAAGTILTYSLYTVASIMLEEGVSEFYIVTIPFVMYGIFRYLYLVYKQGRGDDTAKDLLEDWPLMITVFLWLVITIGVLI